MILTSRNFLLKVLLRNKLLYKHSYKEQELFIHPTRLLTAKMRKYFNNNVNFSRGVYKYSKV